MVRGLVWRRILRCFSRAESTRTGCRDKEIVTRRVVATSCEDLALRDEVEYSAGIQVRGLWIQSSESPAIAEVRPGIPDSGILLDFLYPIKFTG